jgi:hypothetical protein
MAWDMLTGPSRSDKSVATDQLYGEGKIQNAASNAEARKLIEVRAKEIQQARLIKEYGLEAIKLTDKKTVAQLRLNKALEAAGKLGAEWAAKEKERSDIAAKNAADEAAKSSAQAEDKIKDIAKETAVVVGETAKQAAAREKAELQSHKDFLDRIKKQKAAVEDLAKSRVQTVLDAAKAAKDEEKSQAKDDAKAKRLDDNVKRKARLGKKQQDWLDAYHRIAGAKETYNEMGKKEVATEYEIAKQEDAAKAKVQENMLASLKNIEETLGDNLAYSE